MESCSGKMFKFLLVTINFLILLMGLVLLGIGIFAYVDGQDFNQLVDSAATALESDFTISLYGGTALLIIAVSCIIVIVSLFGCCGAWKENRCLLFFNYVCILLLFIGVVAGATIAFTQSIDIIRNPMISSLSEYELPEKKQSVLEQLKGNKEVTESWDSVQIELKCCGVDGYKDWSNKDYKTVFPTKETEYKVPRSCCTKYDDEENCMKKPEDFLKGDGTQGCFTLLYDTLEQNKFAISIGATTIIVFMFVNLVAIFSYVACLSQRRNYETLA